ncbi:MAG: GNAT family N-acetyltransferase [Clostridiales bacterium]|nr:GNAT family N-acetyltransferase [Clostridiales bacterium]
MTILYETDRLIVRQWEDKDYIDLYEYASDSDVTKFLSFPTYTSLEVAKTRIACVKEDYLKNEVLNDYCIEHKDMGRVIGSIGIVSYKQSNEGEVQIGYVLNPKFQGYGYMTEALLGMFKYIKSQGIAKRIVLQHDVENIKSGNVMKRAGMTFEGVLRKAGKNNYHARYDVATYSILDEEISID